jgi:isoquinoline 1-oxidoreductase beta subunit
MNAVDPKLSRRSFLFATAAAGGGLALGFHLPGTAHAAAEATEINAWVVIRPDDTVVIRVARSEMGQGSMTGLCQLVAEELECDWKNVVAEFADTNEHIRRNRRWRTMATGGSRGVRDSQDYVRQAGAAAREMLVAAAAARWQVTRAECAVSAGVVTHGASGRTLNYGAVAAEAAKLAPPREIRLKDPKDWKIAGKAVPRLDIPDKVMGKPVYAIDTSVPGMVHAAIRHCPVFGGRPGAIDESAIRGMKGVLEVVKLDDAVAVVADSFWRAKTALDKLPIEWSGVEANAKVSSDTIRAFLETGLDAAEAAVARRDGDARGELAKAAKLVEAEYETPFQNHATMEPMNCTARVAADRVDVWVATQNSEAAAAAAASAAGVPIEQVHVHKAMLGGGFGRRGAFQDPTREAVAIAKAVGRPVKLIWTREEDMQHGRYRPVSMSRQRAALGADGLPRAWWHRVTGHSIMASIRPDNVRDGVDLHFLSGLYDGTYAVPNFLLDYAMRNTHVPVGFWRAVNSNQNAFYRECFVDEMAHAAGHDPYRYRRRMMAHEKGRLELAVLDAAASKAEWEKPPAAGIHRGIAVYASYGSYSAAVVEIAIEDGEVRIKRVVSALDSGHVASPDSVAAQIEGSIVWALTATLFGAITIKDGRVEQSNFHDYPMLRIDRMPAVEAVLVPSGGFWGGVGEPAVPPIAPALVNAVFAATGKRIRSLPLTRHGLIKA